MDAMAVTILVEWIASCVRLLLAKSWLGVAAEEDWPHLEAGSGEISEEDVGCVTLPWAPTVVSFLNTVDPAKDWTRDMVEFVYCYWSQKFDDDERMPIKVGDFLSLTAADLGLSKHRTMDRW
ncbi:hypothetical protein Pmar_PMAR015863 [Perkinsus marinus ATCC 50983]|uniref:Uncharacterized protein n=1 Tax=Perkinsus marinus (strain ATCC 50983 / TXsc) TaxID=423536 RepID=C5K8B6_PERM5|nr:hypothetical protein Pmar_PMAR015863 [Perkinsus marinus ATCC 50983]EER19304.1 hypothetical protein Pmar_PMAR015863 [Perkinsus marinus ATCC 50983]|eukprot:XP_002787508.1 hypothetical protein Pmar_PMAR015863 [Perkinsus marinus ATCC 50983]